MYPPSQITLRTPFFGRVVSLRAAIRTGACFTNKCLLLPDALDKRQALILLVRAHLGLNQPASAAAEIKSLLTGYPYDAQIHFAISRVIDAADGVDATFDKLALHLCETPNVITIPLLVSGKAIESKDAVASSSVLFWDAVRCAALSERLGTETSSHVLQMLREVVQQSGWIGTADLASMQAALARQTMIGSKVPVNSLHGHAISKDALVPRTIPLANGTVILIPFTLWSPDAPSVLRDLAKSMQSLHGASTRDSKIYLPTRYETLCVTGNGRCRRLWPFWYCLNRN